jgi:hypothetical protein
MTADAHATIKADLPNWPDDVIDGWLVTFYSRFGWPPRTDNDWRYIIGRDHDLAYLQQFRWRDASLALTPEMFSPSCANRISELARTYLLGAETPYSNMSDGPDRFRRCCDYLKVHHIFPRPVVLLETPVGLDVLDGNHRVSAFFYLWGHFNVDSAETPDLTLSEQQPVYIASVASAVPLE